MASPFIYFDTETSGLNPYRHFVWEVAYAIGDGPILASTVPHELLEDNFDERAFEINGYRNRVAKPNIHQQVFEQVFHDSLIGKTIVVANPSFETGFFRARWQEIPWKYRTIDIENYAMPALGWREPKGLASIADALGVEAPDHTATQDVNVMRQCHYKLIEIYKQHFGIQED